MTSKNMSDHCPRAMGVWSQLLILIITLLQTVHVIASQVIARLDLSMIGDSVRGGLSALTSAWQDLLTLLRS